MTVPVIVINIMDLLFVLLMLRTDEIIAMQWSALLQHDSTKCILYEINNIYTGVSQSDRLMQIP